MNTVASSALARDCVAQILRYTGLVQNFDVRASDSVANAAAVMMEENGSFKRYILYNPRFMTETMGNAGTNWAATSIMAHEIGHHLQGHTLNSSGSHQPKELEADWYSGFILEKMGATQNESCAAMNTAASDAASPTHPGKRDRIAAIANGWNAARGLKPGAAPPFDSPAPQPSGRASRRRETWLVVMAEGRAARQKYYTIPFASFLHNAGIQKDWNDGYRIVKIGGGSGRWWVVMNSMSSRPRQTYQSSRNFPSALVEQRAREGFLVTSLANSQGNWAVVMTRGTGYTSQIHTVSAQFPAAWIKNQWDKQYRITSADCDGKTWVVIMAKNTEMTTQNYKFGKSIPGDWIREQWKIGYQIHAAAYTGSDWFVVMARGRRVKNTGWFLSDSLPIKSIKEGWDKNESIALIR